MKQIWTKVRVRIEAETREHLALAAKAMQVELTRIREFRGIKTGFTGTGIRLLEVK
jgi:ribosomal protein L5